MVMKVFILIFVFKIMVSEISRGHNFTLVKKHIRLDVRKFSFSQRNINVWINCQRSLYMPVVSIMCKDKTDRYLVKAGYT